MESTDAYELEYSIKKLFSPSEIHEYTQQFKHYDSDESGSIEKDELSKILVGLGMRDVKDEDVEKAIKGIDQDDDGKLSFKEFLFLLSQLNIDDTEASNKEENEQGITQKKANAGGHHSYSLEEKECFSRFLNEELKDDTHCNEKLPIDPKGEDLFTCVGDGIILCKIINKV